MAVGMTPAAEAAVAVGTAMAERDWPRLRALLSDEFVDHSGYVGVLRWITEELDISYTVEDVVAAGPAVALRATAHGTHTADTFGFPATGRRFHMPTMHWYRAAGDKLDAHWGVLDQLGMLVQVGAVPAPH